MEDAELAGHNGSKGNEGCAGGHRAAYPSLLQGASQDGTRGQKLSPPVPGNFEGEVHKARPRPSLPHPVSVKTGH